MFIIEIKKTSNKNRFSRSKAKKHVQFFLCTMLLLLWLCVFLSLARSFSVKLPQKYQSPSLKLYFTIRSISNWFFGRAVKLKNDFNKSATVTEIIENERCFYYWLWPFDSHTQSYIEAQNDLKSMLKFNFKRVYGPIFIEQSNDYAKCQFIPQTIFKH